MKAPIQLASGVLVIAFSWGAIPAAAFDARAGTVIGEARVASDVQMAASRRCRRRNGIRQCGQVAERRPRRESNREGYGYTYGAPRAEFYSTGSGDWWRAMERE